ncbi:cytochrome c oxidase accessory protein CcoG [Wenxinia saemankumensis]|uniref:Cytochrome c oxidase accessory protein FixG n=1 Tax=Wenxinia saemankumensis TaxID=1447782 RepID=A0A1M6CQU5_9RHOB|nr:cytochrome c oxidase accessory protein CcoG [Wenxinia saemankumensis]SHI63356.1 cytochrome c oxidase accessory protein FixG [Wenxinia saemankumensis]
MTATKSLYAARVPIFPRRVSGRFRNLKWVIMAVTLGIYYLTPWIRWDRGPNLPDQAVLVDLANRRFYFFWIEIWPHEFYFVAGLLVMAGLGLFLFTAALGRVWCGYACPQTVWTDLFLKVERWVQGDRNARLRLHQAPWTARKIRLKLTTWSLWLMIAVATGGAWVFYFADAPTLARDLATLQAPGVAWATIALLTATTFVFGGFMREQVCIYMCPWPRIQGAMMDEGTLTVAYRDWRGEPRGKGLRRRERAEAAEAATRAAGPRIGGRSPVIPMQVRGATAVAQPAAPAPAVPGAAGDCIDCNACVNVCPMGIDIRDGQQMACITCALCIDACDEVMDRIGRPRGLIDYVALSDAPREAAGGAPIAAWRHAMRPRNFVYAGLWSAVGIALVVLLFIRPEIEMTVAPVRNPTFVTLSDGSIRNAYDVRLRNKHGEARDFALATGEAMAGRLALSVEGSTDAAVTVPADTQGRVRVYLTAPPGSAPATADRTEVRLWAQDRESGERAFVDTTFNGRETP